MIDENYPYTYKRCVICMYNLILINLDNIKDIVGNEIKLIIIAKHYLTNKRFDYEPD